MEAIVLQLVTAGQTEEARRLLGFLAHDFTQSQNIYHRKGGLAALAASVHAVTTDLERYLPLLVHPVLRCFEDNDSRVRYYACEVRLGLVCLLLRLCGIDVCIITGSAPLLEL